MMQFLCQLRICIYQSNKIRIILCSRSCPQLRHDDLECLTNTIIPPHTLCSSLQAITERHYIYQETNRRFRIIKISRISALTIIPFMMPHCRIMEISKPGTAFKKISPSRGCNLIMSNSSSVRGKYSLFTTDTIAFFLYHALYLH